jgi:LCP family protein required for cell wall assembly
MKNFFKRVIFNIKKKFNNIQPLEKRLFLKTFLFTLVFFSLIESAGIFAFVKYYSPYGMAGTDQDKEDKDKNTDREFETPLEKAMYESNRINVLLVGLEGPRSDTIMVLSFDRETKEANLISVPRDTYYYREGYSKYSDVQKINAVYGMEEDGIYALIKAIQELTGIPIDNYATIEYSGVRAAVDAIGGIEVDVPFHMRYTDPYDNPPLDINIPAGKQLIKGDRVMELLRFRKTNYPGYSGYPNGDLGRVKFQQEFIKSAIDKALSLKLPSVVNAVYPHVDTDLTITDLLSIGKDIVGFSSENLETEVLPGRDTMLGSYSFYIADGEKTTKLVYDLYDVKLSADASEDEENKTEKN